MPADPRSGCEALEWLFAAATLYSASPAVTAELEALAKHLKQLN
jgi:hypothetical protein